MPKIGHSRTESEVERDRHVTADLYLKGWKMYQIAEKLGLSAPTVKADIVAIEERWMAESLTQIAEAKAREVAKLNRLEFEYWDGWERSKQDAVTETTETFQKDGVTNSKSKTQTKSQAGDPRFLDGIDKVVMDRCRILGITLDVTLNIDIAVLPLEYLERIVNGESEIDVYADWQRQQLPSQDVVEASFQPDPPPFGIPSFGEGGGEDPSPADGPQQVQDAAPANEGSSSPSAGDAEPPDASSPDGELG